MEGASAGMTTIPICASHSPPLPCLSHSLPLMSSPAHRGVSAASASSMHTTQRGAGSPAPTTAASNSAVATSSPSTPGAAAGSSKPSPGLSALKRFALMFTGGTNKQQQQQQSPQAAPPQSLPTSPSKHNRSVTSPQPPLPSQQQTPQQRLTSSPGGGVVSRGDSSQNGSRRDSGNNNGAAASPHPLSVGGGASNTGGGGGAQNSFLSSPPLDSGRPSIAPKSRADFHVDPELAAAAGMNIPHYMHQQQQASQHAQQQQQFSDAAMETYAAQLCKLVPTTSTRERLGRLMRRRMLEELLKLVRTFPIGDLRLLCDLLATILPGAASSTDERGAPLQHVVDEAHLAMELLCASLEHQASARPLRSWFFSVLTQSKSFLPARLLGINLLTRSGREAQPFAAGLANVLGEYIKELDGLLYTAPASSSAVNSPPPLTAAASSILQTPPSPDSAVFAFLQMSPQDPPLLVHRAVTNQLLLLLLRFAKYNLASLPPASFNSIVARVCDKVSTESDHAIQSFLLPFLDIVVRTPLQQQQMQLSPQQQQSPPPTSAPASMASLSKEIRPRVVYALCLCVNISSRDSWNAIRIVLESPHGLDTLHGLLETMDELSDEYLASGAIVSPLSRGSSQQHQRDSSQSQSHVALLPIKVLRGAVFVIAMCSWASQRIPSLASYPFALILQHFLKALDCCPHILLTYEIALALRRLVSKYQTSLRVEWPILLTIVQRCHAQTFAHPRSNLTDVLAEIIASMESAYSLQLLLLPSDTDFLDLLIKFRHILSPPTLERMFVHIQAAIHPAFGGWLGRLAEAVDVFFLTEADSGIKKRAIAIIETTLWAHRVLYANDIVSQIVLGQLTRGGGDGEDVGVRQRKLELLAKIASEIPTVHTPALLRLVEASTACDVTQPQSGASAAAVDFRTAPAVIPEVKEIRVFAGSLLCRVFVNSFLRADAQLLHLSFDALVRLTSHADTQIRFETLDGLTRLRASERGKLQLELNGLIEPIQSAFALTPAALSSISLTVLSSLLHRLRVEPHRECFERALSGLQSLLDNHYLLAASPQPLQQILSFAVEWSKHCMAERRVMALPEKRRSLQASSPDQWSAQWISTSHQLDFLVCVRSIFGAACKSVPPLLIDEWLSCVMQELEEFSAHGSVFHATPAHANTTAKEPGRLSHSHSNEGINRSGPSGNVSSLGPSSEMLEQLQLHLDCCHLIMLSTSSLQQPVRCLSAILERLQRLVSTPFFTAQAIAANTDLTAWWLPVLHFVHACISIPCCSSSLHTFHQVTALCLPLLAAHPAPAPVLAYWASRCLGSSFVALPLQERQAVLPLLASALYRGKPSASTLVLGPTACCLLDFVQRHAFWRVSASMLHETQILPSSLSFNSGLFPPSSAHHSWLQGLSIFSVRIGVQDHVEIAVRRASGTSSWIMRMARQGPTQPMYLPAQHWEQTGLLLMPESASTDAASLQVHVTQASAAPPAIVLATPIESTGGAQTPVSGSSVHASMMSSYSSPQRYIPPSSPSRNAVVHAWPVHAALAPMSNTSTAASSVPSTAEGQASDTQNSSLTRALSHESLAPPPRRSPLRNFQLDGSPLPSPPLSTGVSSTASSFAPLLHLAPLLSYDVANGAGNESSPRLYALPGSISASTPALSALAASSSLPRRPSAHSKSSGDLVASSRRLSLDATQSSDTPSPLMQPVARRATLPKGMGVNVAASPNDSSKLQIPAPTTPPRDSSDASADNSTGPSSFSHHTLSPFLRTASGLKMASPKPTRESPRVGALSRAVLIGAKEASIHSPNSAHRPRHAEPQSSPHQPRARNPANSSLSLLTQAFSKAKLITASPTSAQVASTGASSEAVVVSLTSSDLLAKHGLPLPLAAADSSEISADQIDRMWAVIRALESEEDERKTKINAEQRPGAVSPFAAAAAVSAVPPAASLKRASSSEFHPEFFLSQLQESFPDCSAFISEPSKFSGGAVSASGWQSLSSGLNADAVSLSLSVLDSTSIRDTLRIGVVFVSASQGTQQEILGNSAGSLGFHAFVSSLGEVINLRGETRYTGGMDRSAALSDGSCTVLYTSLQREVAYHISTWLPTMTGSAAAHENKLRLIGNDPIVIAWVERGGCYTPTTLRSQSIFVHIALTPCAGDLVQLSVHHAHADLAGVCAKRGTCSAKRVLPVAALSIYLRQLCFEFDLAIQSWSQSRSGSVDQPDHAFGNAEHRHRQIALLRDRLLPSKEGGAHSGVKSSRAGAYSAARPIGVAP